MNFFFLYYWLVRVYEDRYFQAANTLVKNSASNASRIENLLREQRAANEKLRKEVSKLMTGRINLQTELNNSNKRVKEIERVLVEKTNEYKLSVQEIKRYGR